MRRTAFVMQPVLALLSIGAPVVAQAPDRGLVLSLAGGVATPSVGSGTMAGLASLNFSRRDLLLGARVAETSGFDLRGQGDSRRELALLVGRRARGRCGYVTASTGLALVRSRESRRGTSTSRDALGLPVEAKAVLSNGAAGVGLEGFANFNARSSFAGLALVLEWGRLE